jgi:hypothetical protein
MCMWRSSCIKWSVLRQIVPDLWFADREACLAAILDAHKTKLWFRSDRKIWLHLNLRHATLAP